MVRNFRFEEPGVALSGLPTAAAEVDWLAEQGIRAVVSLHPLPEEARERLRQRGIAWYPYPVEDWALGVPPGLAELLAEIHRRAREEPSVLIH